MKILTYRLGSVAANCYLAYDEQAKQACLIDPAEYDPRIDEAISKHGLELKFIILTHGHFDHILGAHEFKDKTGAQIAAHELELEYLEEPEKNYGGGATVCADISLKDGGVLEFGAISLRVVHTPGHTKGSACFVCEEQRVVFTGDTLFKSGIGRYDLYGGSYSTLLESLGKLKALADSGDYKVYPGHGGPTMLGDEIAENIYFG